MVTAEHRLTQAISELIEASVNDALENEQKPESVSEEDIEKMIDNAVESISLDTDSIKDFEDAVQEIVQEETIDAARSEDDFNRAVKDLIGDSLDTFLVDNSDVVFHCVVHELQVLLLQKWNKLLSKPRKAWKYLCSLVGY